MLFKVAQSVFWLGLAFVVLKPASDTTDINAAAAQAMAAGSRVVAEQIQSIECDSLQCLGGKVVASSALNAIPSAGNPMHEKPAVSSAPVPLPRPRPDLMG
jgi:hypothetical protein